MGDSFLLEIGNVLQTVNYLLQTDDSSELQLTDAQFIPFEFAVALNECLLILIF